jgi:hypothetical protein
VQFLDVCYDKYICFDHHHHHHLVFDQTYLAQQAARLVEEARLLAEARVVKNARLLAEARAAESRLTDQVRTMFGPHPYLRRSVVVGLQVGELSEALHRLLGWRRWRDSCHIPRGGSGMAARCRSGCSSR